ncbi:MAG: hypothetical protein ACLFWH_13030 [Actinomycetota bacterium]
MRTKSLCAIVALAVAACGAPGGTGVDVDADEPVLQIVSEGGFAPVEAILGNGPRYTLLSDGSLIMQGAQTLEYPGRLVPPYMVGTIDDDQMAQVMELVEEIGLPDIVDETDDSAGGTVADATTEVVTYWDDEGAHRLAVYALGIDGSPSNRNAAFLELIETLDSVAAETSAEPYEGDRVRIVAGPGMVEPEFEDIRDWPLESTEFSEWDELANGWHCTVVGGLVPEVFDDATQATVWEHPERGKTKLLVRPLHPGEPDCPS